MENVRTTYKDSVFSLLFNSPDELRCLYNTIANTNYGSDVQVSINTINDALYMIRINVISFTIDDNLVVLIEYQSTINENMPLRILLKSTT